MSKHILDKFENYVLRNFVCTTLSPKHVKLIKKRGKLIDVYFGDKPLVFVSPNIIANNVFVLMLLTLGYGVHPNILNKLVRKYENI